MGKFTIFFNRSNFFYYFFKKTINPFLFAVTFNVITVLSQRFGNLFQF